MVAKTCETYEKPKSAVGRSGPTLSVSEAECKESALRVIECGSTDSIDQEVAKRLNVERRKKN